MIDAILVISLQTRQVCVHDLHNKAQVYGCYPAAIGKQSTPTPTGQFKTTRLVSQPQYVSCQTGINHGIGFLGEYAIVTDMDTVLPNCKFAIHGTNNQKDLGKEVSGGCVRMLNSDIRHLVNNFYIEGGIISQQ